MLWIILCIVAAFIYSISTFFDNYVIDVFYKDKCPQSGKHVNGRVYLIIAAIMLVLFGKEIGTAQYALLAMLAGVITSLAGIPYILGFKTEEATSAAVFFQTQPIILLIADALLLNRQLNSTQILGFIITLCAPIVIIFSNRRKSARNHDLYSAAMFMAYVIIGTISAIIFADVGSKTNAFATFSFMMLGRGISDTMLSLIPSWRKRFKYIKRRYGLKVLVPQVFNLVICVTADFIYRFVFTIVATSIASVVTNALELIFTFILGIILTIILPKFGREDLTKRKIIAHAIAVLFAVVGIIILK